MRPNVSNANAIKRYQRQASLQSTAADGVQKKCLAIQKRVKMKLQLGFKFTTKC